ncbi:MAG TPA: LysR family transcriptional regulator [Solirubrobacteraceae bacterium]|jgi:DNA-binding transcriptional LysR family regulator|nr:LysR family transcriptional regulator [Solirubrobacteraceae bacterium]
MAASTPIAIELRHLRYFLAVSEELHFRRAADRLHISQPPLSQAIRQLEDQLGVQLLHRTSRVVTPTTAGRVFAEEARRVLASFDLAVAEARRAGGARHALRIGCVPHLPFGLLQRFLRELHGHDSSSHSQADVAHLPSLEQVDRLRSGELDLGIFHTQEHEGIESEPLFPGEPLAAFLPPDHPLAAKSALGPDDVREEILIVGPRATNPALQDRVLAVVNDRGYRFSGVREASGYHARDLILAAAGGPGMVLAPISFHEVAGAGDIVTRRPLDPAVVMPEIVLAWSAHHPGQLGPVLTGAREVARDLRRATEQSG